MRPAILRIGFGCGRILGGSEAAASRRLIETALDCGIRHFDTAPSYGGGQSEAILGDVLCGVADVTVTTKVGAQVVAPRTIGTAHRFYRQWLKPLLARAPRLKATVLGHLPGRRDVPRPPEALTGEMVQRSLERSCAVLRRRPDILLLHEPLRLAIADEVLPLFHTLARDGAIGDFGYGTGTAEPFTFGTIVQQRYDPACPVLSDPQFEVFFHGTLNSPELKGSARDRLYAAMARHDRASFVFSASTPAQIRQLTSAAQG